MARPATLRAAKLIQALCLYGGAALLTVNVVAAQVIGNEAELERLRGKAEDAMANEDPEGAAMNMGRAALMANVLAKTHHEDVSAVHLFQGGELLFRAQEHSYRAMALFRRAGNQLPASSGVCGSLALAQHSLRQALAMLNDENSARSPRAATAAQFRATATDWETVIDSIIADYQCR